MAITWKQASRPTIQYGYVDGTVRFVVRDWPADKAYQRWQCFDDESGESSYHPTEAEAKSAAEEIINQGREEK